MLLNFCLSLDYGQMNYLIVSFSQWPVEGSGFSKQKFFLYKVGIVVSQVQTYDHWPRQKLSKLYIILSIPYMLLGKQINYKHLLKKNHQSFCHNQIPRFSRELRRVFVAERIRGFRREMFLKSTVCFYFLWDSRKRRKK